jgi:GABA(A) receptor-associated protein
MAELPFKNAHPFDARAAEARRIRQKFPGRIPVLIERAHATDAGIPAIDKSKFLVPGELTVGQLIFVVRKRLLLPPEKALFLFVGSVLPPTGVLVKEVYAQYADRDGFLYVQYAGETTFGAAASALG